MRFPVLEISSADYRRTSYKLNICWFVRDCRLCHCSFPLTGLIGDVGGQKTLRSYWRNYFEKTDALIWVVDATDRLRMDDCCTELHGLLQEEVGGRPFREPGVFSTKAHKVEHSDSQEQACSYLPTRPMFAAAWRARRLQMCVYL